MLFLAQGNVSIENRIPLWNAFSSKTEEERLQSYGPNVQKVGRWWTLSGTSVFFIFESECIESMTDMMLKSSPFMETCSIEPVCEDSMLIKCIQKSQFFEKVDSKPSKETENVVDELEDESKKIIFMVRWSIKYDNLIKKLNEFANMSSEDPSINIIGRWSNIFGNGGMAIIESEYIESIIDTLLHCSTMDNTLTVEPVIKDDLFAKRVKKSPFST